MRAIALVLAIFAMSAVAADARRPPVRLVPPRRQPVAWVAWALTVAASGKRVPTAVTARNGLTSLSFPLRRVGRGRYRARATMPFAGRWTLQARVSGRPVALGGVHVASAAPLQSALPGAAAFRICSGTGMPYPQYAIAAADDGLWVVCRDSGQLVRVDRASGTVNALFRLGRLRPYSIAAGSGAVWSVDRSSAVSRIDPGTGRVRTAFTLDGEAAYVFAAAGAVWAADDGAKTLVRFDPGSGQVVSRASVGDGTSALVADGGTAWIVNHRDGTLERVNLATNAITPLGRLPGDAPERMVSFAGSLWVTGRGTDLLRVDPATGALQATVDVGAGAIDVQAAAGSVWVFAPTAEDDQSGMPILDRVLRVDPSTNAIVDVIRPTSRIVVNGLASYGDAVWIADAANGRLYRLGPS